MTRFVASGVFAFAMIMLSTANAKPSAEFYEDMNQMCQNTRVASSTVSMTSCYQYIRGFLKGALLTDKDSRLSGQYKLESPVAGQQQRPQELALSNQVGMTYCLPDNKPKHEVVIAVLSKLQVTSDDASENTSIAFPENIHKILKDSYSCANTQNLS